MDQSVFMYHLKNINHDSTTQQEKYTWGCREVCLSLVIIDRSFGGQNHKNYKTGDADPHLKVLYKKRL